MCHSTPPRRVLWRKDLRRQGTAFRVAALTRRILAISPVTLSSVALASTLRYHPLVMQHLDRITHDPAVMGGKPCIRGMRVTVGTIMGLLASGQSEEQILQLYPYLDTNDLRAALAYAAWRTH